MEVVKKTERYTIFKKRSGRYGVRSAGGAWINGADKKAILVEEGLIKATVEKKEEAPEVEESSESEGKEEGAAAPGN